MFPWLGQVPPRPRGGVTTPQPGVVSALTRAACVRLEPRRSLAAALSAPAPQGRLGEDVGAVVVPMRASMARVRRPREPGSDHEGARVVACHGDGDTTSPVAVCRITSRAPTLKMRGGASTARSLGCPLLVTGQARRVRNDSCVIFLRDPSVTQRGGLAFLRLERDVAPTTGNSPGHRLIRSGTGGSARSRGPPVPWGESAMCRRASFRPEPVS